MEIKMKTSIFISRMLLKVFISMPLLLFLIPTHCLSQPPDLAWIPGPQIVDLGNNIAQIDLGKDYQFANSEDTIKLMEYYGNPPNPNIVGSIAPKHGEASWFILFNYSPLGYVRDDERDNIDSAAILESIKRGQEKVNKTREKKGFPPINIVGWHEKPHYEANSHNLVWTLLGEVSGAQVAYHNVRLLGRYGVMSVVLTTELSTIDTHKSEIENIIAAFSYKKGKSYSEFIQGDRVSKDSLTDLIASGTGAVADRTGLLKALAEYITTIVIGVIAFFIVCAVVFFAAIWGKNKRIFERSVRENMKNMVTDDSQTSLVERISERAIKKKIRSEAIHHPFTVLPLTLFGLSIIYLGIFPATFGGTLLAIILLISSGVLAAASFFWRYSVRYSDAYSKQFQELMESQEQAQREKEQAEIEQLLEATQSGFQKINSVEGIKAVKELIYEYDQLQHVFEHKKEKDSLGVAHIPALAEETYRQGLSVLEDALEVGLAIHSSDKKNLEEAVKKLEKEIELLGRDETQAAKLEIKQATMSSHKERLDMIKQEQLRVDKLLYQCDRCEASLHRTRMELASLKVSSSETSVSAVTETLQKTINQAKEVQEELKKLGY
jgi:uncharacterized membrane-anchored protein